MIDQATISVPGAPASPGLNFRRFRDLGMDETALGVDTENPSGALRSYESMGDREIRRHTFYQKEWTT